MKIPTAEELLRSIISNCGMESHEVKEFNPELWNEMVESIKEQNKFHVKAALDAASKTKCAVYGTMLVSYNTRNETDVDLILESYPETNIV